MRRLFRVLVVVYQYRGLGQLFEKAHQEGSSQTSTYIPVHILHTSSCEKSSASVQKVNGTISKLRGRPEALSKTHSRCDHVNELSSRCQKLLSRSVQYTKEKQYRQTVALLIAVDSREAASAIGRLTSVVGSSSSMPSGRSANFSCKPLGRNCTRKGKSGEYRSLHIIILYIAI